MTDPLLSYMIQVGRNARTAAASLIKQTDAQKSAVLLTLAKTIRNSIPQILAANQKDLEAAEKNQLSAPLLDRLRLTAASIEKMALGVEQIAHLPDPVGALSETRLLPNGVRISQMRIPLGVIGIIYESRPNVTIDAAALCFKSGNACILRGGSEAYHSNQALGDIIQAALAQHHCSPDCIHIINTTDRAIVTHMVQLTNFIDVIIPRGGRALLERLKNEAKVPLILHLDGNCHVYIDQHANLEQAIDISVNAKTYRYGVCGTMETLLVHRSIADIFLPRLAQALQPYAIEFRACSSAQKLLPHSLAATEEDWSTEYLAPILAVKVVDSIESAITHIQQYSSQHTESIVTDHSPSAHQFQQEVTSSSVYVNLPTCFADGFEYGLGAEIGISTNKLHARGPVGLEGLTTYKWVLVGEGQLRGAHQ